MFKAPFYFIVCLGTLVGYPTIGAQAQAAGCPKDHHRSRTAMRTRATFKLVLLAVHGWNGDCVSTFGAENESIFKVIEGPFYDMDCFQYDSKNTALDKNVDCYAIA